MVARARRVRIVGAYAWEILAEPITIHYTAVNKDGTWQEVDDRTLPGKEPVCIFEKNLKRVRDKDWPAAGAISSKSNTRCNTSADAQESDLNGSNMTSEPYRLRIRLIQFARRGNGGWCRG